MIYAIVALVIAGASSGAVYGIYHVISNRAVASVSAQKAKVMEEIAEQDTKLTDLLRYKDGYCSKAQFEGVSGQLGGVQEELDKERGALKEFEERLDTAQGQVEGKEAHQQELKSSKEEDEIKLEELLANYQEISTESIALEQKLAESMKNLEAIMSEVEFTEDQKTILDELSDALSKAGENLRNLLTEYESVNERLTMLREQHEDLEEEYTKLVEQQLGE